MSWKHNPKSTRSDKRRPKKTKAAHDTSKGEIRACSRCGEVDLMTDESGLCKWCREWVEHNI